MPNVSRYLKVSGIAKYIKDRKAMAVSPLHYKAEDNTTQGYSWNGEKFESEVIKKHYDEFLGYYYNSPCSGCPEGHASFWKTVIESPEWKAWKDTNPMYDFAECEELGIMGKEHFKAFITFVKRSSESEVESD